MLPKSSTLILGLVLCHGAEIPRVTLDVRHSVTAGLTAGPSFAPLKCDQHGNLYVRMVDQSNPLRSAISKISRDGKLASTFSFDINAIGEVQGTEDFTIGQNGEVSSIVATDKGYYLVRFRSDGKISSTTQVSLGRNLAVHRLVSIGSGNILVLGEKLNNEVREPATFVIDQGGNVLRFLDTKEAFNVDNQGKIIPEDIRDFGMSQVASEGANIYVMRPLNPVSILALSFAGNLTKRYEVNYPEKGYIPLGIYASGSRLAITFLEVRQEEEHGVKRLGPKSITRVVDQESGVTLVDYVAPKGIEGAFDCYVAPAEFVSLTSGSDGRFKLVTMSE